MRGAVSHTIVAKCGNDGILLDLFNIFSVSYCTIDGNAGDGINFGGIVGPLAGTFILLSRGPLLTTPCSACDVEVEKKCITTSPINTATG